MGTDIHLHVELRVNGRWEHYAMPSVDRWYSLFGVMAGVRGGEQPIVQPKGVPEDMSVITRLCYEYDGQDAHTASWFNEEEINRLSCWLEQKQKLNQYSGYSLEYGVLKGTYLFGDGLTDFKTCPGCLPKGCDSVRLVFWFDS
jgi:hypothetical protein